MAQNQPALSVGRGTLQVGGWVHPMAAILQWLKNSDNYMEITNENSDNYIMSIDHYNLPIILMVLWKFHHYSWINQTISMMIFNSKL